MGVNSLRKTVTRQRHDCDFNPGPSAPESSTLTTRLPRQIISFFIFHARDICDMHDVSALIISNIAEAVHGYKGADKCLLSNKQFSTI